MKSLLFCMLLMGIIFAQTTARLDKDDRSNIKRILRDAYGKEAYPYESEEENDGHEGETEPVTKIDWHDGEDPIRKILRAVHGGNEYPVERVKAQSQDGGKGEEDKLQPEQKPDTRPAAQSIGKEEKPQPEQKPGTHHITKPKSEEEKPKPEQNPVTGFATKFNRTNQPPPCQTSVFSAPPRISHSRISHNIKSLSRSGQPVKSTTNSSPPKRTSTTKSSSYSGQNPSTTPGNQYTLPDKSINKQVIDSFKYKVDKTWSGTNYEVRFKRDSPEGDAQLWWRKGNDKVYMIKHAAAGAIRQEWTFGVRWPVVNIELKKKVDGRKDQIWDFWHTKLNFSKNYWMGEPYTWTWMSNKKDESSLRKYAGAIQSWCDVNDFFIGKEDCVIFSLEELIDKVI